MQLTDVNNIKGLMVAGNATLTFRNKKRGTHLTFKIKKAKEGVYYVSHLSGTDNETSYSYTGLLNSDKDTFYPSKKLRSDCKSVVGFSFIHSMLKQNNIHNDMEIFHEGKCCRCGRKLTTPDSILRGLGSDCASR